MFYKGVDPELHSPEDAEDLAGFMLVGFKERCTEAKLRVQLNAASLKIHFYCGELLYVHNLNFSSREVT